MASSGRRTRGTAGQGPGSQLLFSQAKTHSRASRHFWMPRNEKVSRASPPPKSFCQILISDSKANCSPTFPSAHTPVRKIFCALFRKTAIASPTQRLKKEQAVGLSLKSLPKVSCVSTPGASPSPKTYPLFSILKYDIFAYFQTIVVVQRSGLPHLLTAVENGGAQPFSGTCQ
jgi:hypothetical protein